MVVDDFANLAGFPRSESEAFYSQVLAKEDGAVMSWEDAYETVRAFRAANGPAFYDKVMFHYLHKLSFKIDPDRHDASCAPFAEFFRDATWVFIRRANIFEQAVSKYVAEELNIWDKRATKDDDFNLTMQFNVEKAKGYARALAKEDRRWSWFFRKNEIQPIEIYYEDAVGNYPHYLEPIFSASGMDGTFDSPPERRMRKLGNQRNLILSDILRDSTIRDLMLKSMAGDG
ncbi:Stf0 sulfotransferase [Pseudoruegeria aquimaris]|uniref:Stf0 sulfotransferase n=2 Tax=Pseudoruegeria aquimaris TaxID=393663 RepID=A0A1Y5RBZ4_9RHOB|nr:Stf0 sulfotransferase [Pseudoruegeria aquimaris]